VNTEVKIGVLVSSAIVKPMLVGARLGLVVSNYQNVNIFRKVQSQTGVQHTRYIRETLGEVVHGYKGGRAFGVISVPG
jgi:hypothetical protein